MPEVQVNLTEADEWIYVTISDTGPGIPAFIVWRTSFDPFMTAGKPNGIFPGLTLARRIAEEHGGQRLPREIESKEDGIHAESEQRGKSSFESCRRTCRQPRWASWR